MEQTVAGVRIEGSWRDVVNTSERITEALQNAEARESDVDRWDDWRPREEERFHKEVRDKTVEKATVRRNAVERDGKSTSDVAEDAVGEVEHAVEEVSQGDIRGAATEAGSAAVVFAQVVETVARKTVRQVETVVYRHVVCRFNPYYFDTETISATLTEQKPRIRSGETTYELSVTVTDSKVYDEVCELAEDT